MNRDALSGTKYPIKNFDDDDDDTYTPTQRIYNTTHGNPPIC